MKKEFESARAELAYKQKKFIPVNIIVTVISLIAALTLMFAPILSFDMGKLMSMVTANDGNSGSEPGGNTDDGNVTEEVDSDVALVMGLVTSVGNFKISFGALDFLSSAKSDNPLGTLLVDRLVETDILETLGVNAVGVTISVALALADDAEVTDEKLSEVVDVEAIGNAIRKAETDEQGAAKDLKALIIKMTEDLEIDIPENFDEEFDNKYAELLDKGRKTAGGAFNIEYLVCQTMSENECSTYRELANKMFGSVSEQLGEQADKLKIAFGVVFGIVFFPALMWLLLAVLAGTHILRKKKIFATWYVETFGFIPCIIFGIIPLVVGKVVEGAAVLVSALSSMTWISGACFIALVLLLWFYLYRTRRNIKRLIYEAANEPITEPAHKPENENVSEVTTNVTNDSVAESASTVTDSTVTDMTDESVTDTVATTAAVIDNADTATTESATESPAETVAEPVATEPAVEKSAATESAVDEPAEEVSSTTTAKAPKKISTANKTTATKTTASKTTAAKTTAAKSTATKSSGTSAAKSTAAKSSGTAATKTTAAKTTASKTTAAKTTTAKTTAAKTTAAKTTASKTAAKKTDSESK